MICDIDTQLGVQDISTLIETLSLAEPHLVQHHDVCLSYFFFHVWLDLTVDLWDNCYVSCSCLFHGSGNSVRLEIDVLASDDVIPLGSVKLSVCWSTSYTWDLM